MRAITILAAALSLANPILADDVSVLRVPEGGRVPHVAVASDGTLHLAYGREGDGYHVRADRAGGEWSRPVRINSTAGSCSVGKERSPRLAVGKDGVLHAIWQDKGKRVCHARSTDGGATWSPERNLAEREGVDMPAIAADGKGGVWAIWIDGRDGEDPRQPSSGAIYFARSEDDGETWGPNRSARTRACACCALDAAVGSDGRIRIAFRGAFDSIRDVHLLVGDANGERFDRTRISDDGWKLDMCPMDGPIVAYEPGGRRTLVAWRSRNQVFYAGSSDGRRFSSREPPAASGGDRLYPIVVFGKGGSFLFAWTEGDEVAWELHDRSGRAIRSGRESGLPSRGRFAVIATPEGGFRIMY